MNEHDPANRYLTVRQVAEYLHINQKKVYALAAEGQLPGTRVTGKWLFPRELIDQWLLQTSHGGALMDLLLIGGAEDRLMRHVIHACATDNGPHALICYSPQTSRAGLAQLDRRRLDASLLHWGPREESERRHDALLQSYQGHSQWVLVHLFQREQGLLLNPALESAQLGSTEVLARPLRWVVRQEGSGTQRFLLETLARASVDVTALEVLATAVSEDEAASLVRCGDVDVAPGTRAVAQAMALPFVATGWESVDLAMTRSSYFKALLQQLLDRLRGGEIRVAAEKLGGYDLSESGAVRWKRG